jgi:hypothetical protein
MIPNARYLFGLFLIINAIVFVQMSFADAPLQGGDDPEGPPAILSFQANVPSLRLAEVEAGQADVVLSWTTINLSPEYDLFLDQFVINEWLPVERPAEDAILVANGDITVAVEHPLNFGSPTFRLSIMEEDVVIDQHFLVIPYEPEHDIDPTIDTFTMVEPNGVTGLSLANGTARLEVAWRVNSRIPGSNLVFEQVFEDAEPINIELPRSNLWVRSSGTGILVPIQPPGRDGLRVRLRIVDTFSDRVYDEMVINVPIVAPFGPVVTVVLPTSQPPLAPTLPAPTETLFPPVELTPTPTPPRITSFSVTPDRVNRDETVTLSWDVEGPVTRINIELLWEGNNVGYIATPAGDIIDFPTSGTHTYTVSAPYSFAPLSFKLVVEGSARELISEVRTIQINCVFSESLLDRCPETQTQIEAAYQPFEHGFMVWRGDLGVIYTVFEDLRWSRFGDTYVEGETIDIDDEPPAGLFAPERGFGKVWAENPNIANAFGWATRPEEGYTATVEVYALPGRDPHLVMTLPDGSLMEIIGPSPTVRISPP